MAGAIISDTSITVSLLGKNLDATGIVNNPELAGEVKTAITSFANIIQHVDRAEGVPRGAVGRG